MPRASRSDANPSSSRWQSASVERCRLGCVPWTWGRTQHPRRGCHPWIGRSHNHRLEAVPLVDCMQLHPQASLLVEVLSLCRRSSSIVSCFIISAASWGDLLIWAEGTCNADCLWSRGCTWRIRHSPRTGGCVPCRRLRFGQTQIFNGVFSVLILQCQPHAFRIALEIFKEVQKVVQVETQQRHALVALIHPRARVSDVASAGPFLKPLWNHLSIMSFWTVSMAVSAVRWPGSVRTFGPIPQCWTGGNTCRGHPTPLPTCPSP